MLPFSFGAESFEEGQSVSVQCSVSSGDLPLNIMWLFDNDPIQQSNDIITSNFGHRASALSIEPLSRKHVGNYTCLAVNDFGKSFHTAQLIINGSSILHLSTAINMDGEVYY